MLAAGNPDARKVVDMPYEQSVEEKVRAEYEMRQKAWRDRASQMEEAYQKGYEQGLREAAIELGRQEGIQESAREMAKRMKDYGLLLEEIVEFTGLDAGVIQGL
jgi:predicted transposase/invertase (TIGR01784 family)